MSRVRFTRLRTRRGFFLVLVHGAIDKDLRLSSVRKVVGQPIEDPASTVRLRAASTIAAMGSEYRKYTSENPANPSGRPDSVPRGRGREHPAKHSYLSGPRMEQNMEPITNDKWREIRPIIDDLERLQTDGRYIFRGEAKEFPNISSSSLSGDYLQAGIRVGSRMP